MTKSSSRVLTHEARGRHRKTAERVGAASRKTSNVAAQKVGDHQITPKVATRKAVRTGRKTTHEKSVPQAKAAPKLAAEKLGDTLSKAPPKPAKSGGAGRKTASKLTPKNVGDTQLDLPKVAAEKSGGELRAAPSTGDTHHSALAIERALDTFSKTGSFERVRNEVPNSMRALAERSVAQARERYELSENAFHAVLESCAALNHKIIEIAERNVSTSFDLAMSLCGAKNLPEMMALQKDYWRKQGGNLSTQAEEVRALSTRLSTDVAELMKSCAPSIKTPTI